MQRSSVDLPEPEGPIRQVTLPGGIVRLTSFSAWKSRKNLLTPRISTEEACTVMRYRPDVG